MEGNDSYMYKVQNIFSKFRKCSTMDFILFINVQGGNLFKMEFGSSTFKAEIRSRWISRSSNIIV
jgi:hypothetical protein